MALENCVQLLSSVSRAENLPFSSNQNTNSTVFQVLKKPNLSLSFFPRFSTSSVGSKSRFRQSSLLCKARGAINDVKEVTESSWDELVTESKKTVVVDFWAPWCGPCKMIDPIIKELAEEFTGKDVEILKLNTDSSPNIASKYGIRSIPTLLFFKNGEKKEKVVGAVSKSILSDTIKKYLDL